MSKELTVPKASDFLALAQRQDGVDTLAVVADSLEGVSRFELPQLRVPSGGGTTWEYEGLEGPVGVKALDVVVLAMTLAHRKWFRVSMEEAKESNAPPDCSSSDGVIGNGWRELEPPPEEGATSEQKCSECKWSQWKSARNGRGGQDCSQYGLALVFVKDSAVPMVLSIPATSLKATKAYRVRLAGAMRQLEGVVTRLTLSRVSGPPTYSVIEWKYLGDIEPDAAKRLAALKKTLSSKVG